MFQPFWKVTADGNSKGYGIVGKDILLTSLHVKQALSLTSSNRVVAGVLEANFIEPAHDKQDFERSSLFSRLEMKLRQMQMDYWFVVCKHSQF